MPKPVMPNTPVEEMRPGDVVAAHDRSGCAFIPISPALEWHSWHLPLGTDGLVAETLAALAAAEVGGVHFRVLSFGLDDFRTAEEKAEWGLPPDAKVFGMRFPALPIVSEYCEPAEMRAALRNRVAMAARSGFRRIYVVNAHGGRGQAELVTEECEKHAREFGILVRPIIAWRLDTSALRSHPSAWQMGVGGHAGLSETLLVLAFRPELVDLTRLPEGELRVAEVGILHDRPVIEARNNQRLVNAALAQDLRRELVSAVVGIVRDDIAADAKKAE